MSLILGFDTSSNSSSVAISRGQHILAFYEELRPHMQAEQILILIEKALHKIGRSYRDLDYLVTTCGPGSFTGIRIGLATAVGIRIAAPNIKDFSVSNFELSHYRALEQIFEYDRIIILLNAYRNQIYLQEFGRNQQPKDPQLLDIEEVLEMLKSSPKNTTIAGNALQILAGELHKFEHLIVLPRFPRVKAVHLCRYADECIKSGKKLRPLQPLYIRPPDAKISAKKLS